MGNINGRCQPTIHDEDVDYYEGVDYGSAGYGAILNDFTPNTKPNGLKF